MSTMKTLTINGVKYDVTPVVPANSVTLLERAWVDEGERHSQVVEIPGVTPSTKVDLQPTAEQLVEFHDKILAFVAENDGGVVTVYAIGHRPTGDHTIQTTLTEVEGTGKIRGNTVGTTMPNPDWNQTDPAKADYIKNKPTLDTTLAVSGKAADAAAVGTALASKAPAGYGLGAKLTAINHIDNANKNGFYQVNGSVASGHPFDYGAANILVVGGSADLMPTQIGFGISMNPTTNNAMAIRAADGIWEWFNPPMKVGVEYRTTERHNGKPVYVKTLDLTGAIPLAGNSAEIAHGISMTTPLTYYGTYANQQSLIGNANFDFILFTHYYVYIKCNIDSGNPEQNNFIITLKYVKD